MSSRHFSGVVIVVTLASWLLVGATQAITITAVQAPANIERPYDGDFYPFDVRVTGTANAADVLNGVSLRLYYEDMFGGFGPATTPLVDGIRLTAPANSFAAGSPLTWSFQLNVGCDPVAFGPSSGVAGPMSGGMSTNQDPMLGQIRFAA